MSLVFIWLQKVFLPSYLFPMDLHLPRSFSLVVQWQQFENVNTFLGQSMHCHFWVTNSNKQDWKPFSLKTTSKLDNTDESWLTQPCQNPEITKTWPWHDPDMTLTWPWQDPDMTLTLIWHEIDMTPTWPWHDPELTLNWSMMKFMKRNDNKTTTKRQQNDNKTTKH